MLGSLVHRFQKRAEAFRESDVACAAAEPSGLFEIRLGEAADRRHFCVGAPFSISSAAPMPNNKSASAKPVGSCTPFSFEHPSQRFTFCILPSRIWVRKTVASLHLQTSQCMTKNWTTIGENIQPPRHESRRRDSLGERARSLRINRRPAFLRQLPEARNHSRGDRAGLSVADHAAVEL